MVRQQIAAPIFDINLRVRRTAIALLAVVATVLAIPTARAQTLMPLHTFSGTPDGREPIAGLTMGAGGNLYGTTYYGGTHDMGLVYKLARRGAGFELSPLYSFQGGQDGARPSGGVTVGSDGNLYGTTNGGGPNNAGTVYKLSPPAAICRSFLCPWSKTILYQFTGGADGGYPGDAPTFDRAGNLYGTPAEAAQGITESFSS